MKINLVPFEKEKHLTEKYRSWFNDPEVTKYNSHGLFPYTKKQMKQFVKDIEEGSSNKIVWAIEVTDSKSEVFDSHIGNCSLDRIDWVNRSAEFTIVIGDTFYHGKGVGRQCLQFAIDNAFYKLNLNRVWTGTAQSNVGMRIVAEACGMTLEGTFRKGVFLNGCYQDVCCYGILDYER